MRGGDGGQILILIIASCFVSLLAGNGGLGVVSGGPNAVIIAGLAIAVLFILANLGMHNEFSNP